MTAEGELLVGLVCVVGILGTIVPVLPGGLLVAAAVVVWAALEQTAVGWLVVAVVVLVIGAGAALSYLVPGRRVRAAGVPWWTLTAGGVGAIVGFVLIPVVGLPIGFVLTIYLVELARLRSTALAWPATRAALAGAGLSMLISLAAAVLATSVWAGVAVTT